MRSKKILDYWLNLSDNETDTKTIIRLIGINVNLDELIDKNIKNNKKYSIFFENRNAYQNSIDKLYDMAIDSLENGIKTNKINKYDIIRMNEKYENMYSKFLHR